MYYTKTTCSFCSNFTAPHSIFTSNTLIKPQNLFTSTFYSPYSNNIFYSHHKLHKLLTLHNIIAPPQQVLHYSNQLCSHSKIYLTTYTTTLIAPATYTHHTKCATHINHNRYFSTHNTTSTTQHITYSFQKI